VSSYPPVLSVPTIADIIKSLTVQQLLELRTLLTEGGDPTGVGALIPPNLPLKEGGAEVPFKDWPAEYFENME
jgi:hypothetical protein